MLDGFPATALYYTPQAGRLHPVEVIDGQMQTGFTHIDIRHSPYLSVLF
jgi:hypothetical protein